MSCCTNTYNLGCFNNCSIIAVGLCLTSGTYNGVFTYGNISTTITVTAIENEPFLFDLSLLNENATFTLAIYDENENQITLTIDSVDYDCFKVKTQVDSVKVTQGTIIGCTPMCKEIYDPNDENTAVLFTVAVDGTTITGDGTVGNPLIAIGGGGGGGIESIVAGDNITIDNTDPLNPIVSASGGGTSALFPNGVKEITESRDLDSSDAGYILVFNGGTEEEPIILNVPYPSPLAVGESFVLVCDNVNKVTVLGSTSKLLENESLFFNTGISDGNTYTFPVSSSFIEGKTALRYLYDQSQNAIPLSGTVSGSPVTGDIETNNKLIFVTPEYGKKVTLSAQFDVEDDAEVLLPRSAGTIALQTDIPFISLENVLLAGNNSENNINVNNGFFVNIIGGGGVAFYTNPDFSDASSIVPMANPYEGLLLDGNEDTSKGLTGQYDYSANITSLSYTQKIYVDAKASSKQDTLVSGTNIKTINGTTILGSGDMTVGGQVDILQIQMFI